MKIEAQPNGYKITIIPDSTPVALTGVCAGLRPPFRIQARTKIEGRNPEKGVNCAQDKVNFAEFER